MEEYITITKSEFVELCKSIYYKGFERKYEYSHVQAQVDHTIEEKVGESAAVNSWEEVIEAFNLHTGFPLTDDEIEVFAWLKDTYEPPTKLK